MATFSSQKLLLFFAIWLSFYGQTRPAHPLKSCKFDQIYQLGDSLSDTGNLIRESAHGASTQFARLPYGVTFFKNATGRCSNGLLMVDYIARAAGLPLLPPYTTLTTADFTHGINFAVAGATAMPYEFLASKNIHSPDTNSSIMLQVDSFTSFLNSTCLNERECPEKLERALVLFGEIGGNDYNFGLLLGQTVEQVKPLVPDVVSTITEAANKVINLGAKRLVVPGNFPIGCLPAYKTVFEQGKVSYDENGCVKELNEFAAYHNEKLNVELDKLRGKNPKATIVYGDWYNAYLFLLKYAKSKGFDTEKACCGIGGKHNFDWNTQCGHPTATVCSDPNRYMSWDGLHLTQESYKILAGWLIDQIVPKLNCHRHQIIVV